MADAKRVLPVEDLATLYRSWGLTLKDVWDPQGSCVGIDEPGNFNDRVKICYINEAPGAVMLTALGRSDLLMEWMVIVPPGVEIPTDRDYWLKLKEILDEADPLPDSITTQVDGIHGQMTPDQFMDHVEGTRYFHYPTRRHLLECRSYGYWVNPKEGSFSEFVGWDEWLGQVKDDELIPWHECQSVFGQGKLSRHESHANAEL